MAATRAFSRVMLILIAALVALPARGQEAQSPLRLAIIGFTHGHVEGLLWNARENQVVQIVGVYEPNVELFNRLAAKYGLAPELRHENLAEMLDAVRPEAVSVMTSTADHLMAVEACAPRGVHLMVEKPLAVSNEHAGRMAALAREHGVHLLTNYETSWYTSLHEAKRLMEDGGFAPLRRADFRHGHKGPREIGVGPEFLAWLTDPDANGAGALFDFGCYGANQMTWLMEGRAPDLVVASVSTLKPDTYPRVDDDATMVLTYPDATAVIQASWAWTHDTKEADLFTEGGSLHCGKWDSLSTRRPEQPPQKASLSPRPPPYANEWSYLRAVVRDEAAVDPLSSLENNLVVVRILDAARRSVETGRAIVP